MDASTSPTTERSATARVHDPQARAPRRAYRRRGTRLVQRSPALDLFRGLVMAGMIIVGSIRTFPEVRPVLHHAPWRGLTVVDLGLPFLLFIVGVAAQLSLQSRRRAGQSDAGILRHAAGRATMLVIIGIIGVSFPNFDPATVTLTGVLQFIAVGYLVATMLLLRTSLRTQVAVIATVLVAYWLLLTVVPVPDSGLPGRLVIDRPSQTIVAWVDRHVLGAHMDPEVVPRDPQGILPMLVAVTTVMLGALAGRWLRHERRPEQQMVGLFAVGMVTGMAGLVWGWTLPVIKGMWTSSYVLVTAGGAAMALGLCIWLTRLPRSTPWITPIIALGVNALLAYAGFYAVDELLARVHVAWGAGPSVSLREALFTHLVASWLPSTLALTVWGVLALVVWLAVTRALHRRGLVFTV